MFPMGMVTQRMTQGRWQSKLFTSSTTWTVPADVGCIWVDGCGGGAGGSGGYNGTGGGGGAGGSSGTHVVGMMVPVSPGEILTISIGAGGSGGAAGQPGGAVSQTVLSGNLGSYFRIVGGINNAGVGTASTGGTGGMFGASNDGGAFYRQSAISGAGVYAPRVNGSMSAFIYQSGSAGGNSGANGSLIFNGFTQFIVGTSSEYRVSSTGNVTGGGGGHGGHGLWGEGGIGGAGGAAGGNATGYGSGGGGGGGNAAGGNGSPGLLRIYCLTSYAI